jgi:hypothetical protein
MTRNLLVVENLEGIKMFQNKKMGKHVIYPCSGLFINWTTKLSRIQRHRWNVKWKKATLKDFFYCLVLPMWYFGRWKFIKKKCVCQDFGGESFTIAVLETNLTHVLHLANLYYTAAQQRPQYPHLIHLFLIFALRWSRMANECCHLKKGTLLLIFFLGNGQEIKEVRS